jgi:DNA-binding MarR family transcriptional regulator
VIWGGARQYAAALAPSGLTVPQYAALTAIAGAGACTMGALAVRTHHALGTMTGLVDRLIRHGLVARRTDAADRRIVVVQLTPAGMDLLGRVEAMRRGQLDDVVAAMGEPGVRTLSRLLDRYLAAMGIEPTAGPDLELARRDAQRSQVEKPRSASPAPR